MNKSTLADGARLMGALVIILTIAVPAVQPVHAQSALTQQIEQNKKQEQELNKRINALKDNERALADQLAVLDDQIESLQEDISNIENQLETAEQELADLESEMQAVGVQLGTHKQRLASRAVEIYMQDELTYVDLLFQAASVGDFIDRMFFVQAILEQDEQLIDQAQRRETELREKRIVLDDLVKNIRGIREHLSEQMAALESLIGQKKQDIEAIQHDEALYRRQIKELNQESERIKAELAEMTRTASGYQGAPWTGSFKKPCAGSITSGFGNRVHPVYGIKRMHTGVDIGASKGTAIKAAGKGKVIYTGRRGGYGKTVMIDHGNGRVTLYAHMSKITCSAGDIVDTSSKIGEVGSTGISTGNHLHFEVRINGDPVDPLKEL